MKKWLFIGCLGVILSGGLAYAQTKMVIIYKDGKAQVIDLRTIFRIEHQKAQPTSLSADAEFHLRQGLKLHE